MSLILNPNAKPVPDILVSGDIAHQEFRQDSAPATEVIREPLWLIDCTDLQKLVELACVIHFERLLRGVVTCHERTIFAAACLRTMFDLHGSTVDTTLPFINKHAMKARVAQVGVRRAPHVLMDCGRVGWRILPASTGRIFDLTEGAVVEWLSDIVKVEQYLVWGDSVEGERNSCVGAYAVYFAKLSGQHFSAVSELMLERYHGEIA